MENDTKRRILYLYQHLVRHTDAEHTLSTAELMKILKETYAIQVSRNTISDDLAMLHDCGLHIERYKSTQNRYYYDGQIYELPELKILVDAIASSRFITQRKSDELIAKLLTLTSSRNAARLRRHIYAAGRAKSDNENGYYIVDAINTAIDARRKISFRYTDFDVTRQRCLANGGNPYTVSPYALIWDGDCYYMRGFCDERREMRNFRLDRIAAQPEILSQTAVAPPEDYNPADYSRRVFRMYDTGEPVAVQLRCHVSVMKYLMDQFGGDFKSEALDDGSFRATVRVCTSATFYSWIFGFNGKIKITGPDSVVRTYQEMALNALSL